jgi:NADH-quinone oxidoreductase subunit L
MAIPLIVLAIGSVFAGYVGVPHALGGSNRIETFLEPSFEAHGAAHEAAPAEGAAAAGARETPGAPAGAESHGPGPSHADTGTELMLMAISSGIAIAGIGIAAFFWLRNRNAADAVARRFRPIHQLLLGKYYVDEIYDATIVQPVRQLSTGGLWKGVDVGFIDGAVNGVGAAIGAGSSVLRRLQTGSMRAYAFGVFAGVVAILGYYLIR